MEAHVIIDDSLIRHVSRCSRSFIISLQGGEGSLLGGDDIENFAGKGIGDEGE